MVTRVPALEVFADRTGDTFVHWEHFARMMADAPGCYSTKIGRGNRNAHLRESWLCSVFLAGVIGDPKNAATKVPLFGDLIAGAPSAFFERVTYAWGNRPGDNSLLYLHGPSQRTIDERPLGRTPGERISGNFFLALMSAVDEVAREPDTGRRMEMVSGLEIVLHLGGKPMVVWSELRQVKDDLQSWLKYVYLPADLDLQTDSEPLLPIGRTAIISGQHILLLASLWANSLQYIGEIEPNSDPSLVGGGEENNEKPAGSKTTKADGAPPPPTFAEFNHGPPANQPAPKVQPQPHYMLSLSPREGRGAQGVTAGLQEGSPSTANQEIPHNDILGKCRPPWPALCPA